jgi:F0F1-type ATP synthase assembly protein I
MDWASESLTSELVLSAETARGEAVDQELVTEICEAALAMVLLGLLVAGLYWLFMGSLPWTFFLGELLGFGLGFGLLVVASPRRARL